MQKNKGKDTIRCPCPFTAVGIADQLFPSAFSPPVTKRMALA